MLAVNLVLLVLVGTVLGKDWKTERTEDYIDILEQLGPNACCGVQCGDDPWRWPRTHGCAAKPEDLPLIERRKKGQKVGDLNPPFQCIRNPCVPKNPCPSSAPFCINYPKYCLPGKKCPPQHECHKRH